MSELDEIAPVTVIRVDGSLRSAVENLLPLYLHDLSEFRGTLPRPDGHYAMGERRAIYFTDPDRLVYLFMRNDRPVGFAMLKGLTRPPLSIGEFFVIRAVRRLGVGHDAALRIFELHPGRWEWAFQENNVGAARFWRGMATELAGDTWLETQRPVPGKPHVPPDVWISLDTTVAR
ncbi:MAG: GNAT family N-acetyltransferase [Acidimicrobiales bacterium]